MTSDNAPARQSGVSGKTVQDYIDETPVWADATPVGDAPITDMQWLIWGLAAAGKFFEGMVVFTTGVALPLMGKEFALGATEKGVVAASSLFGILIGATLLGGLADRYGRKQMFIAEMVLFCIFTAVLTFSPSYAVAVAALVGIGVALGCDYPTAHLIISESIPSRIRGRMVLAAFGFQAMGGLVGTAVGFLILFENPELEAWRWMYGSTIVLAVPVTIGRFFIVQSPLWLMYRGRIEEAEIATERLLRRDPPYPKEVILHPRNRGIGTVMPRQHPGPRCFKEQICTGPSLLRCHGSCRTLVPMVSEFSLPPSWRRSSVPASIIPATLPSSFRATSWPRRVPRSSTCC
jgi:MFS family permease